jgi:UDPglucose 6-dehydrogenase/GDP-mannose 6-dehydrogenase
MYQPEVLEPISKINDAQPYKMIRKLEALLGDVEKKKVAVLGVSFMPETDDITDSPGIKIIRELLNKGAKVYAVDPQAVHNAKLELGDAEGLKLAKSYKEALREADAALLVTAWDEFKKIKPKEFIKLMKRPVIIDGRRLYDREEVESYEIIYTGIGMDK